MVEKNKNRQNETISYRTTDPESNPIICNVVEYPSAFKQNPQHNIDDSNYYLHSLCNKKQDFCSYTSKMEKQLKMLEVF